MEIKKNKEPDAFFEYAKAVYGQLLFVDKERSQSFEELFSIKITENRQEEEWENNYS